MYTRVGIDHISLSVTAKSDASDIVNHPALPSHAWIEQGKGMHGYTNVRKCRITDRIEANAPNRPEMGTFLQYGGESLVRCDVEPMELLFFHWLCRHNFTRLDIAFDLYESRLKISDFVEIYEQGYCDTTTRTATVFAGAGETKGATLYLGSPQSTKRLRIYDKAAEQGVDGDWVRIELQLRKEHAAQAVDAIARASNRIEKIKSIIKGYADFDMPLTNKLFSGESHPLRTPRKESRTRTWLLTQVAKAMASYIADTDDTQVAEDVISAVHLSLVESGHRGIDFYDDFLSKCL